MSCASSISAPADPVTPESCDLSVIIVNYNVRDLLEQALRSVFRAADGLELEVFVVDNNSVDGSVEMVRAHFPEVHLIANTENVGFSRANNQAIRRARGRYLLLLNPDTIVQEDTLRAMVDFLDAHPEVGAAGCKILNPDGSFAPESRRSFPTPAVASTAWWGSAACFHTAAVSVATT
ncbi:glycosyltransferase family 2 protein [Rhodothermus marinus]|uniref:glycosyltransferase family 2 protein n=1 Tax=Rhodothermus marinus TaxID=29549 RepID=UPI001FB38AE0|nr:glycosyltransferase family 2 protein [Rhodothermus marinus]